MQLTIEPTDQTCIIEQGGLPVRTWISRTATGVPVEVLVLAISPRGASPVLSEALNTLRCEDNVKPG